MKFNKVPGDMSYSTDFPVAPSETRTNASELRSFLGEGTDVNGEVRFTDLLRVDASVSGSILSEAGSLVIGERGRIKANIEAASVEILGSVEGSITAKTKVEIRASGRVHGDIYTPALIIEYGAVFDGKCHMDSTREESKPRAAAYKIDRPSIVETKKVEAV
jgi:cytoskeletal protein CcmA (bactofilin family)